MTSAVTVPFLDLRAAHDELADELNEAFDRVRRSGWFVLGEELEAFEREFAAACGAEHCVGVNSGLDAIALVLRAHGVGAGDEVIVPAHTFVATWLGVSYAGAVPVPVPVDPATFNLDPERVEEAIGPRTRALLPVHLYGQPADMAPLRRIAEEHGLVVVEDAAQAHGARYGDRVAGSLGHSAAFSFYPGKNLGAMGDGGAIVTFDPEVAERCRSLRNYGSRRKYHHDEQGQNTRLDELQAAVLRIKLRRLEEWNARRRTVAERYLAELAGADLALPAVLAGTEPVWHLFVVRSEARDELQRRLADRGVQTLIHYPVAPHRSGAYAGLDVAEERVRGAEELAATVLSLPMGPHLSEADVEHVVGAVREAAGVPA